RNDDLGFALVVARAAMGDDGTKAVMSALGGIRTPDPQIRSLVLYPAELRARHWASGNREDPLARQPRDSKWEPVAHSIRCGDSTQEDNEGRSQRAFQIQANRPRIANPTFIGNLLKQAGEFTGRKT